MNPMYTLRRLKYTIQNISRRCCCGDMAVKREWWWSLVQGRASSRSGVIAKIYAQMNKPLLYLNNSASSPLQTRVLLRIEVYSIRFNGYIPFLT